MAAVRIDSGDPEHDDRPYMWPVDRWKSLLFQKKEFLRIYIPRDCRCILEFIEDAEIMWQPLGYSSKDELIERGLELDPADVKMAVDWLKIKDPGFEIPFQMAVDEGRKLAKVGAPVGNKNASKNNVDNVNIVLRQKGGNSKDYLKARIARDFPEEIPKIEAGEISVRQAAIQSGIIRVKTPFEMVMALVKKLSVGEIEKLVKEINSILSNRI